MSMKMKLRSIIGGLLLALATPLTAFAQCSGQAPANTFCGNPTGSLALPGWKPSGVLAGAPLTKVDDTNVTLTLTGTPAMALLQATGLTLGWNGQLSAARGGTGFGTYAVGDLLFAGTTSALSKLPDVATGNALISGGVGVPPAYGKIGISTHVSGLGTGVATALGVNVGTAGSFVVNGGALGTPSSGTATNLTGLPIAGITGLGTGVPAALAINVGSAGAFVTFNGALGTPSSGVATNLTGTAAGLTAGNVTTNANLTGAVTSVGNATSLGSFTSAALATAVSNETGSGALVFATSPALTTPTIAVGSDATGDIYYRNAGGLFTRLPIGSSTNVLTVTAGIPAWAAGGGAVSSVSNADGSLTVSPTSGAVVASINPAGSVAYTGSNSQNNLQLQGGSSTNGATGPYYKTYANCVRPEQFGGLHNGLSTTDNVVAIAAAAAASAANLGVGLCFSSSPSWYTSPIQFGGSAPNSGTFTGTISGTTLTVTAMTTASISFNVGQTITGAGITAGTEITGVGTGSGGLGTYTVNNSQAIGSITMTATAPTVTASITGTVMTVTAVTNGTLKVGFALAGTGITTGTYVTSLGTGTGGTGTYNINVNTAATGSITVRQYPVVIAALPSFIRGEGSGSTIVSFPVSGRPSSIPFITVYDPIQTSTVPYGFSISNLFLNATTSGHMYAILFSGFNFASASDITAVGALGKCGVGIESRGFSVIYASFARFRSGLAGLQNQCGYNFNGNNGDTSYNLQAVDMTAMYAQGNLGLGFNNDYANYVCTGCEAESNGSTGVAIDHSNHIQLIDFYTEANVGGVGISGTANSLGVMATGQLIDPPDTGLLNNCTSCQFRFRGVTLQQVSSGMLKIPRNAFASTPTCNAALEGGVVMIADSTTAVWGAAITVGGGASRVLAFCSSTGPAWTVMAK